MPDLDHLATAALAGMAGDRRSPSAPTYGRRRKLAAIRHYAYGATDGLAADVARQRPAAGGRQAALGKTQTYETHRPAPAIKPTAQAVLDQRSQHRWSQLLGLRKVSSKTRVRKCKTPIGEGHVGFVRNDTGAHMTGLQSCANVWCCPLCAPKIRAGRMQDVLTAFDRHRANGGGFCFLTITVQHNLGHRLAETMRLLQDAWTNATRQRAYKEWRKRCGLVGYIAALEVTDGDNGWHPHKHMLLFTEGKLTKDMVDAWAAVLDELYSSYLEKHGRDRGALGIGVRLDYVKDDRDGERKLAQYVTKVQAGFELARGDLKASRDAKGRLPFDLLDAAIGGDDAARARWQEYEQAMTGKSAVRFSKGLRGLLGMAQAKTDEELAEEEVGGDAGLYVGHKLYRRLFWAGQVPAALQAYRDAGDLGVMRLVQSLWPGQYVANDNAMPGGVILLE